MSNSGEYFEKLVFELIRNMSERDHNSAVERNVEIVGTSARQIDILVTTKFLDFKYVTIVECKDHKRRIGLEYIDALDSKSKELLANKAIAISRHGFTNPAIIKAAQVNIDLCRFDELDSVLDSMDKPILVVKRDLIPVECKLSLTNKLEEVDVENIDLSEFVNSVFDKTGVEELSPFGSVSGVSVDLSWPFIDQAWFGDIKFLHETGLGHAQLSFEIEQNFQFGTNENFESVRYLQKILENRIDIFVKFGEFKEDEPLTRDILEGKVGISLNDPMIILTFLNGAFKNLHTLNMQSSGLVTSFSND